MDFTSPSFRKVSLAVSSEQKKISTYGKICSIHSFASAPVQRFPLKFTSKENNDHLCFRMMFYYIDDTIAGMCTTEPVIKAVEGENDVFSKGKSGY